MKLTKRELEHICEQVVGWGVVKDKLKEALDYQDKSGIKCWVCEDIAKKLEIARPQ